MKTGITEKWKKKIQAEGVQGDMDRATEKVSISRNAIKSESDRANHRNSSTAIAAKMGHMAKLGDLVFSAEGKFEPIAEYSETAQEIKMRKAAEKRARRSMH